MEKWVTVLFRGLRPGIHSQGHICPCIRLDAKLWSQVFEQNFLESKRGETFVILEISSQQLMTAGKLISELVRTIYIALGQ